MTVRRFLLVIVAACALVAATASAQGGGQFCVRAFEDRNGNGQRDAGEPLITRGIGANLLDSTGRIVGTALLDDSPTGAQGVVCFQNLAVGQYTIEVTSAEYEPTTSTNMTLSVTGQGLPTVFDFGGQRIDTGAAVVGTTGSAEGDQEDTALRLVVAGLGALAAMAVIAAIGVALYYFVLRPRFQRAEPVRSPHERFMRPDPRRTTGSMRQTVPVPPGDETDDFDTPTRH